MKRIYVGFALLMMSDVLNSSQASDKNSSVVSQADKKLTEEAPRKTTLSNGDIRLEFSDGTYCTVFAHIKKVDSKK
ncbi:MAG: hypothetical protein WC747_00175 [Candidatus Babeliales bacterium]|jgi:hypothetical protein